MMIHMWSQDEIEWIRKNAPGKLAKDSYIEFMKAFEADDVTLMKYRGAMKRYGITTGVDTRRKKGEPPVNKGKKMSAEQYEKCRRSFFKKGNQPPNKIPIGGEKIASGYTWVKVDDKPHATMQENFKLKHHMVWEEHNGPIEPGCVVIFLDGDPTNITIENLQQITKSQHNIMNRKKLRQSDPNMTKTGVITAQLIEAINKRLKDE